MSYLGFLVLLKDTMATATFINKAFSLGWLAYSFRGTTHYHYEGEHGSQQTDIVLELRVLHLAGNM